MKTAEKREYLFGLAVLVLGLIVPLFVHSMVWMTTFNVFFFYAMLTISYNMVLGYAGLFSFCHVSFGAIGGYTSALIVHHMGLSPFLGVIIGFLAATLCGTLLGMTILRVRGFYLCLITWAFGMVVENILKNEHQLTGGTGGFLCQTFFNGPNADLYAYFLGLMLLLVVYLISTKLFHSRWGLYLFSVRDDIDAAETLGVNTRFWKVFGFAFGSGIAGIAGAFYAHFFSLVDPTLAGLDEQGKICLMVIIGGLGTVIGPVLGAFFVVIISELIRGYVAESSLLIFSVIMILTVRFAQGGFMQILELTFPRLRKFLSRTLFDRSKSPAS